MADIELVIKIPEEYYENLLKNCRFSSEEIPIVSLAIATGTPLPKGHGNIIDVNSIKEISLSNITYHMVWQPRNDTELKCRIEAPILVKSDAKSEITVKTEGEN
jgi:hypothetical protein